MTQTAIETQSLTKRYGQRPAVRELTFQVQAGEVYALVGPNGAGKTTVIRLVTGLAFPSAGSVTLLGHNPHQNAAVRRRLGAVVEAPAAFYPYLTGRANLRLHAKLVGGVAAARIAEVLDMMELGNAAERKVRGYSLGMRQRLGVAAAILTRPDVLILDEPASGMDPLSLHLVHRVLRQAAAEGAAVLLSTHHLNEVVAYCSRVAILEEGALIDEVNLLDRKERYRARVSDVHAARLALETQPYIQHVASRGDEIVFMLREQDALGRVPAVLAQAGVALVELGQDVFNLPAYYQERLQKRGAQRPTQGGRA